MISEMFWRLVKEFWYYYNQFLIPLLLRSFLIMKDALLCL